MSVAHNMKSLEQAAIVLLTLNTPAKEALLSHLSDLEVQRLFEAVRGLGLISHQTMQDISLEFEQGLNQGLIAEEYQVELLHQHLSSDRQARLKPQNLTPWSRLEHVSSDLLAENLHKERPEVVAVLLSKLTKVKSSEILHFFKKDYASLVLIAFSRLKLANDEAIAKATNDTLLARFQGIDFKKREEETISLLEMLESEEANTLLAHIANHNATLAEVLSKGMLTFERLMQCDSRFLQDLLSNIPHAILAKALALSTPTETEFFLLHLSQKAGEIVEEELDLQVGLSAEKTASECQTARRFIVIEAKALKEGGRYDDIFNH